MRVARDLLRLLQERWPADGLCCHALTLHEGEVKISLRHGGAWDAFFIEEADLEKDAPTIVAEIEALLRARDLPPGEGVLVAPPLVGAKEIQSIGVSGEQKKGDGNCA